MLKPDQKVALYMEGDERAKQHAWNMVRLEQRMRQLARTQRRDIDDRKFPSLGHKLGGALSVVEPKIPDRWLDIVIGRPVQARQPGFARHLPKEVRAAVVEYRHAQQQMRQLAGEVAVMQ